MKFRFGFWPKAFIWLILSVVGGFLGLEAFMFALSLFSQPSDMAILAGVLIMAILLYIIAFIGAKAVRKVINWWYDTFLSP